MAEETFHLRFWAYPWPPRDAAEEQMLYDHIRTVALLLDALPSLLKLPFLDSIPYYSTISRIPGLGLDSLLGFALPIVGDMIGLVLGLYQVLLSCLFGLPYDIIIWMLAFVAIDAAIGSVPIIGDAIDLFFTSNLKNLGMLDEHLRKKGRVKIPSKYAKPVYPSWFTKVAGDRPQRKFKNR